MGWATNLVAGKCQVRKIGFGAGFLPIPNPQPLAPKKLFASKPPPGVVHQHRANLRVTDSSFSHLRDQILK